MILFDEGKTWELLVSQNPQERLLGEISGVQPTNLTVYCGDAFHEGEELEIFSLRYLMVENYPKFIGLYDKRFSTSYFTIDVFQNEHMIGHSLTQALSRGAVPSKGLRIKYSLKCPCGLGDSQREENFRNTLLQIVRIGNSEKLLGAPGLRFPLKGFILLTSSR